MLVMMIKKFSRYSSLQRLILAANNFAKVSQSDSSLRLMILRRLKKTIYLGKFLLSVCSPSPSRRTTEENQCKMMQWAHTVPVLPAEWGTGGPLAPLPALGRLADCRAISDVSFHSTSWGHQHPPGSWLSSQRRAPSPPPLLAAPSAPQPPLLGLALVRPGVPGAWASWTQPAQPVGMTLQRERLVHCVFCSGKLSGGWGWS